MGIDQIDGTKYNGTWWAIYFENNSPETIGSYYTDANGCRVFQSNPVGTFRVDYSNVTGITADASTATPYQASIWQLKTSEGRTINITGYNFTGVESKTPTATFNGL